jgi:hypothetical protein
MWNKLQRPMKRQSNKHQPPLQTIQGDPPFPPTIQSARIGGYANKDLSGWFGEVTVALVRSTDASNSSPGCDCDDS